VRPSVEPSSSLLFAYLSVSRTVDSEIHSAEDDARAPPEGEGVHERERDGAVALPQPHESIEETQREERKRDGIDGVRAGPAKVPVVEDCFVVVWNPDWRRGRSGEAEKVLEEVASVDAET